MSQNEEPMLQRYSMGIGDRFGCQGVAQLQAFVKAAAKGVLVTPVWNKSEREHGIIRTKPGSVRLEADASVRQVGWKHAYHVDADHIHGGIVDKYLETADFFTIDVAEFIGGPVDETEVSAFVARHGGAVKALATEAVEGFIMPADSSLASLARKYLPAVRDAGRTYRKIAAKRGTGGFVTEVSMDEADIPQTPLDLFLILAAMADEGIRAQTIAPKFSGRFNKGVDYVGDVAAFRREFEADVLAIRAAVRAFGLPSDLKLSVHSGSDKYSLYTAMRETIVKYGVGLHLKTAGTTWLEELAGLAAAGGDGLALAKEIYVSALGRLDELCAPYATVIDIDPANLPAAATVNGWNGAEFVAALRNDTNCSAYNPDMRQMLHVGYKVAAEMGDRFRALLRQNAEVVGAMVGANVDRHLMAVFGVDAEVSRSLAAQPTLRSKDATP